MGFAYSYKPSYRQTFYTVIDIKSGDFITVSLLSTMMENIVKPDDMAEKSNFTIITT